MATENDTHAKQDGDPTGDSLAAPSDVPKPGTIHLMNGLPHARNQRVLVDGSEYKIDEKGIMRDVKEAHAHKLMQNKKVWAKYDPRHPVVTERRSLQVALIDDQGRHFHADRSATRKQLSGQPLLSDNSKLATDLPHAVDSHNSQKSIQPLVDDQLNVAKGPDHQPDMGELQAHARSYQRKADGKDTKVKDIGGPPESDIAAEENASGELNLKPAYDESSADSDMADSADEDSNLNPGKPKGKHGKKH